VIGCEFLHYFYKGAYSHRFKSHSYSNKHAAWLYKTDASYVTNATGRVT